MPLTPGQIKDKLINALDDAKNVIDEEAIEEVITLLEASTLSKEILEQTRLGRDINLVRKTCKNPLIAKRAKNLVKSWQKLLTQPSSPQVANGQHPACVPSPARRLSPGLPVGRCGPSPAQVGRCGPSPAQVGRCGPSPAQVRQLKAASSTSPAVQTVGKQSKPRLVRSPRPPVTRSASVNVCNEDSNLSWPGTPTVVSESSQDRLAGGDAGKTNSPGQGKTAPSAPPPSSSSSQKRHFNFDSKSADHSTPSSSKSNRVSDQRDVSKTNVANRKRTREPAPVEDSNHSSPDFPSSKQPRLITSSPSLSTSSKPDVINGSTSKKQTVPSPPVTDIQNVPTDAPSRSTTPKMALPRQDSISSRLSMHSIDSKSSRNKTNRVKTTEQLIEDMQLRSATTVGTEVIAQIRTQQLQKESDQSKSNVPTTGKRRGRKKKKGAAGPPALPDGKTACEGRELAQAKSEYIKRFLQTSVAPTPGEDNYEATTLHNSRQESLDDQPMALGECSSTFSQTAYDSSFPVYPSRQDKPDSGPSASPPDVREMLESGGQAGQVNSRMTEEQILALLPPIDVVNIDWTSHEYPSPQRAQVGEDLVDRLHSENMDGVNGAYDRDGQFRRWEQMLTMDSVYDEPLYILPYVIPND